VSVGTDLSATCIFSSFGSSSYRSRSRSNDNVADVNRVTAAGVQGERRYLLHVALGTILTGDESPEFKVAASSGRHGQELRSQNQ